MTVVEKMAGKLRSFGRCSVKGHKRCALTQEIQAKPMGRAAEKRRWKQALKRNDPVA